MQAVALAAREGGDALLLVAAAEIERCDVGARGVVRLQPRLGLRLACARRHLDPRELARERALSRHVRFLLLREALLLLVEPGGIVPLPGDPVAAIELEDPAGRVVEEVAV